MTAFDYSSEPEGSPPACLDCARHQREAGAVRVTLSHLVDSLLGKGPVKPEARLVAACAVLGVTAQSNAQVRQAADRIQELEHALSRTPTAPPPKKRWAPWAR